MAGAVEIVAGAAVGELFSELYKVVVERFYNSKTMMFKSFVIHLSFKLDFMKPLIEDIQMKNTLLDCPNEKLQSIEEQMRKGIKVVCKCSEVRTERDWKETLNAGKYIPERIENLQIKENAVLPNHSEIEVSVPEIPPVIVGLEVPLRDLKRKLLNEDGVSMLVFCEDEQVKDKFKSNIFFVTVSPKPNLEHIVQQLYQQKGTQKPNNLDRDEAIATRWLQQFMEGSEQNRLLLVLDDVSFESKYVLEKFDELKMSNHKLLVTSRYELRSFGSPYYLKSLNHEDAMKLFHHAISLGDKQSYIPEELQEKIVERCKGFPIAITVVGRSLCGQPIEIWQQRIDKWSEGSSMLDSEVELLDRLQSSLDALDKLNPVIKKCFMDLCSFPGNHKIPADTLIDIWAELYELGDDIMCISNLYELSTRSLANLVIPRKEKMGSDGYYSEHFVTQHDMLRDLAVIHTKNVTIQHRERLIVDIRGGNLPSWLTEQKYQPVNARLISITPDGVFSTEWHNVQLPKAEICDIIHLKKLSVTNCQKLSALPEDIGKLLNLEVLRLSIMELPKDIGELSNLRKLNMRQCLGLQRLPPSILDIVRLNTVICDEVTRKLWEPLHPLKNVCITVVKEDMDSSSSLTTLSSDNHVATRTEKREVMEEDILQAKFHAELNSEIKVFKAEMKKIQGEMKALKDEFSPVKNKLDVVIDLLVHVKQGKNETAGDETIPMK
ncbi:hypothetical protein L3X38_039082 [Prunus dulcis]|uniref:NB-ARC domain-containing disease resistance protein n=1 Tax=Prunus dulcis TaxID=3755 RepID=A0AAD4YS92_PRUDU|nr:hypothetical protein L3X38_039082 [Prunus dulcis]